MKNNLKSPFWYLKESLVQYREKKTFTLFSQVMAILVIVRLFFSFILNYFFPADFLQNIGSAPVQSLILFFVIFTLSVIAGIWVSSTTYTLLFIRKDTKEVLYTGFKMMGKYFLTSLLLGLVIILGLVLLIVPGVLFTIWFLFSLFIIYDKKVGVIEAFKLSKKLIKGRFIVVSGKLAVIGTFLILTQVIVSFIPYAGYILLIFLTPLLIYPLFLLYKDLRDSS